MRIVTITDPTDPRVEQFRSLTDVQARQSKDVATGTYIAESFKVLERALSAGHRALTVLTQPKWVDDLSSILAEDVEVCVVDAQLAESITGFAVHRGVIAVMQRPEPVAVVDLIAGASTLLVADDITDHTNMGALFRAAAALGADAVLLSRACADPLYRRSVRVSMGTVFQVPWARFSSWPKLRAALSNNEVSIVALALTPQAKSLRSFVAPHRVALVVGTEGDGLSATALAHADHTVKIAMREGVDSLNVATAAAIALWAVTAR